MTATTANKGKTFEGTVVSDKMNKTVVVSIERFVKHPKYGKFLKHVKRLKAHDEEGAYKMGDKVIIEECRPLSKTKTFKVISKA